MHKVIIAGAGPGDPELITLKLSKALREVDVIIVDRLVNPDIIKNYANPKATVIFVGKEGYNPNSFSQEDINSILVAEAKKGQKVLRLKGGDVAFFSNVVEELNSLCNNNISFEIIPGITAASGASAYTGIPLTARGIAKNARLITFEDENTFTQNEWLDLSTTLDTLVVYMGAKKIKELIKYLCKNNANCNKSIAVIEQATTPFQKVFISTIENGSILNLPSQFSSPTLIIIGAVVDVEKKYRWFESDVNNGTIFTKLLIV
jgi:uroporphyrin-III C-methyltransferase